METLDAEELELKRKLEDADTLEERREIRRQLRELRNRRFDEELKKVSAGDYKSSRGSSLTNGTDSSGSIRTAASQPSKPDDQEDTYGLSKIDNEEQLQELLNETPYTETDKRRKIRARLREVRNAKFSIGEPVETKRSHRSGSERTADEKVNSHSASNKSSDAEKVSSSTKASDLAKEKERERQKDKEKEERKREEERQKEKERLEKEREREEQKEREREEQKEREREEQKERERQERERERQEREREREEQKERERQEKEREREEQKERERQEREREREEQKERERQEKERKREEQRERERREREREEEEEREKEKQERARKKAEEEKREREEKEKERERERQKREERKREEEREAERERKEKERAKEEEREIAKKRAENEEYEKGSRLPKEDLKKDIKIERNKREKDVRDKLKNGHASEDQRGPRNRQSSADAESEDDTYYLRGPSKRGGIRKAKDEVDREHESANSRDQADFGLDYDRFELQETKDRHVDDFDERDLQETDQRQDFGSPTQEGDYEADENAEVGETARTWSETSSQEGSGSHDYEDEVRSQGERSIDSGDFSSKKPTVTTEGSKTDLEEVLRAKEPGLEGGFKSKLRKSGRKFEQKQASGAEQVDFRNQLRKKVAPSQAFHKTAAGGEQVDFRSVLQRPVKTRADSKPVGGEQVDFRTVLKQGAVSVDKKETMGGEQVDFRTVLKKSETGGSVSPTTPASPVLERAGSAKAGKKPPPAPPKTKSKLQKSSGTEQHKEDKERSFSSSDGSNDLTQELTRDTSEKTTVSRRGHDSMEDNETPDPKDASEEIVTQDLPETESRPETEVDYIEENEKKTDDDYEESELLEESSSRANSVSLDDQEEDAVLSNSQDPTKTDSLNADSAREDTGDGLDAEEPPSVEENERRVKSDSTASTDDTDAAPKARTFSQERTYSKERSGSKTDELKSKLEAKAGGNRNGIEDQTKKKETPGSIEQRMAERRRQRVIEQRKKDLERRSNRMAFKEQLEKNSPKPLNQAARTPLQRTNSNMNKLLNWAQRLTASYEGVTVTDFSGSWADGMAFCALLDHFAPDKIQFYELDPKAKRHNLELAFRVAAEEGVPELLEADDFMRMKKPDPKCVATYLNSVYQILVAERQ